MKRHLFGATLLIGVLTLSACNYGLGDCTDGAARCDGSVAQACVMGAWVEQFDCADYADDRGNVPTCRDFGAGAVCVPLEDTQ